MTFTFTVTLPKINENWWKDSRNLLNQVVEDHNKESWSQQRDPVDQNPWKPRKPPTGTWPLLRKTGRMQDDTVFSPGRTPMTFNAVTTNYGPYMQYGTRTVPARRWLGIGGMQVTDTMARVLGKIIFSKSTTKRYG